MNQPDPLYDRDAQELCELVLERLYDALAAECAPPVVEDDISPQERARRVERMRGVLP